MPRKTNPKLVMRTKKIFVGGLSATTSLEDIRAYFEQFSKVKEAMLAYDKVTSRHRGFGFVTFDNEDVVDKICEIHFHEINGIIRFIVVNYELFYREDCKFSIYFYNFYRFRQFWWVIQSFAVVLPYLYIVTNSDRLKRIRGTYCIGKLESFLL